MRLALGHDDRAVAKAKVDQLAAKLRRPERGTGRLTLGELFDNYVREVTPTKGERKQRDDRRATALFLRVLGAAKMVDSLTHPHGSAFVRERRRLGGQGLGTEGAARLAPVRTRTIAADLEVLQAALNWAVGAGWIVRNPMKGFSVNRDEGVRRPIITGDEYENS